MSDVSPPDHRPLAAATDAAPAFGPWQLVRLVGEGEWARVFQARPADADPLGPADYAVKILKAPFATHPAYVDLLRREDYVGRRITHRHLAPVLASSLKRAPCWIALPYLEGISLETRLCVGQALAPAVALWTVRQVAEALVALHAAGWMHGDVKPHNIVVSPGGHATLVDLGFSRAIEPTLAAKSPRPQADMLAATPAYAAPETFADPPQFHYASDIYSLGITLFECLTGRRPFLSNHVAALAESHQFQTPPDVRQSSLQVPAGLADLVSRMLSKNPESRPSGLRLLDELVRLEIETFDQRSLEPPVRYLSKSA